MRTIGLLTVTDEPQVTERTRFYLFFETSATTCRLIGRELTFEHHPCHRITVEVSEATYRKAYDDRYGVSEMTLPLDDHWWHSEPTGPVCVTVEGTRIRSTRGGYINWEG